jgi:predicted DNA-binding WGR domain protein
MKRTIKQKKDQASFSGFGFKINFVEKKTEHGLDHVKLEHTTGGHNKYYIMQLLMQGNSPETSYTVKITYGKMNSVGGTKKHGFKTLGDAYKFIAKKLAQEIKKGYKRIT